MMRNKFFVCFVCFLLHKSRERYNVTSLTIVNLLLPLCYGCALSLAVFIFPRPLLAFPDQRSPQILPSSELLVGFSRAWNPNSRASWWGTYLCS